MCRKNAMTDPADYSAAWRGGGEFRRLTPVRGNNNTDKARRIIKSLMRVTTAFA